MTSKQIAQWNRKVKRHRELGRYIGETINAKEYSKLSASEKGKLTKQVNKYKNKRLNENSFVKIDKVFVEKSIAKKIIENREAVKKENKLLSGVKLGRGQGTVGNLYKNVFSNIRLNSPADVQRAINQPSVSSEEKKYKESYLTFIRDIKDKCAISKFKSHYEKFILFIEKMSKKDFMKMYLAERGIPQIDSWLKYYEEDVLEDAYGYISVLAFEEKNKDYMYDLIRRYSK